MLITGQTMHLEAREMDESVRSYGKYKRNCKAGEAGSVPVFHRII